MIVTADDRTGALEMAGSVAQQSGRPVVMWPAKVLLDAVAPASGSVRRSVSDVGVGSDVVVADLASRHLGPVAAASIASSVAARHRDVCHLHKIDSLLRGNWAAEVVAIAAERGERIVVVPAFPAVGRTCRGGIVEVDGRPVGDGPADPLTRVTSSRPADHLRHAGVAVVDEVADVDGFARWFEGAGGAVVCDASSDADVDALTELWSRLGSCVLAGPSGALAAGVGHVRSVAVPPTPPTVGADVVIVCGSLHPRARAQVALLAERRPDVVVVASDAPAGSVEPSVAVAVAAGLAADRRVRGAGALVVLGGDTAAAVLGDRPVSVGGMLAAGTPWMHDPEGRLVVTRAGGFGGDDALVSLVDVLTGRMDA